MATLADFQAATDTRIGEVASDIDAILAMIAEGGMSPADEATALALVEDLKAQIDVAANKHPVVPPPV